jgi:hypothetical protein
MSEAIKAALANAGAELALKQRDDMEYREAAAITIAAFLRALPAGSRADVAPIRMHATQLAAEVEKAARDE